MPTGHVAHEIVAVLSLLGVAFLILLVQAYAGHRSTGDQAGFALGMLLFLAVQMPVIGGAVWAFGFMPSGSPVRSRRAAGLLLLSGIGCIGFAVFYVAVVLIADGGSQPDPRGTLFYSSNALAVFMLGVLMIAAAMRLLWLHAGEPRSDVDRRPAAGFVHAAGALWLATAIAYLGLLVSAMR